MILMVNNMFDFEIQKAEAYNRINQKIENSVSALSSEYKILEDAMNYSLSIGGKRIRPIILREFYKLCGGEGDYSLPFELALEMIHTYSLIHDDLPCMDDDDFRRGKPACHKAFGEDMAVLAGDALLTEAFKIAAQTKGIPAENVLKAIEVLAECAGLNGMVGGQVMDILGENNQDISLSVIKKTYSLKTGALIVAAAKIGCILAGANDKINYATTYAENIGLAFQIVDDILDVKSTAEVLGKPIGSDISNNKKTFVSFYGVKKCEEMVFEFTEDAIASIDNIGVNGEFLKELAKYLAKRDY